MSKASIKTNDVEGRRISITVTPEQYARYSQLPWGTRNRVLDQTLAMILDAVDEHGELFIGAILGGNIKFDMDLPPKKSTT